VHYFALRKIKDGKPQHAEQIYRRIIDELLHEEEDGCDHAKLAVTTLLLALLLQRTGDSKNTRSVSLHFFRIVVVNRRFSNGSSFGTSWRAVSSNATRDYSNASKRLPATMRHFCPNGRAYYESSFSDNPTSRVRIFKKDY
jgi:hypothetical protein